MDDFKTHVHSNGLPTEGAAFNKASLRSDSIKSRILVELEEAGETGLTPDEFVFKHGGLINTIRRRFTDLWKDGKIKHHPTLLTRKNTAGNDCVAWVLGRDLEMTPRLPKRRWVGLTEDEVAQAMFRADAIFTGPMQFKFARELEAKLKEKNCGV
jgi:hypothetical protein